MNGYTWLFACADTSIYFFGHSRSSQMVTTVMGSKKLGGVLVVDRYAGYNRAPCMLQYCYAHLLRDVIDLEEEFPRDAEISRFVTTMASLLSSAMALRGLPISDQEFYERAASIEAGIRTACGNSSQHLAIKRIQDIFLDDADRLYHWAHDRMVPAENNYSERETRGAVSARKISYGSQSPKGASTRSSNTSLLKTAQKRLGPREDPVDWLTDALDQIVADPKKLIYELLPRKRAKANLSLV
jgi:hypothetical protein